MMSSLWRGKWMYFVLGLGILGGLTGCASDESSPVGAQLLEGRGFGKVTVLDSIEAVRESSYHVPMALGKGKNLVGRAGGLTANMLLLFSTFPETLREVKLEEAELRLISDRVYADKDRSGAETGVFYADVYEVRSEWSEDEVRSDALPDYDPQALLSISIGASAPDTATYALPVPLVEGWMDTTAIVANRGILIVPPEDAPFLKRFGSSEHGESPLLWIRYRTAEGESDSTTVRPTGDATWVYRKPSLETDGNLILADGDVYRSLLRFDLPEGLDTLTTVNSAVLSLKMDRDRSFVEQMTVEVWPATQASWEVEASRTEFSGEPPKVVLSEPTFAVSIEIRSIVQDWIRDPSVHYGIMLRSAGEQEDVFTVFLSDPRLRIIYSEPPGTGTSP